MTQSLLRTPDTLGQVGEEDWQERERKPRGVRKGAKQGVSERSGWPAVPGVAEAVTKED